MKKIVFATGNPHKLQELKQIAGDCGIEFVLPPEGFDPIEDGNTFEENSYIKALEASRLSGMTALADDSGLCVEALEGAPGIYSARYAETQQKRIDKLLKNMEGITNRKAKFVCAMTLVSPDGEIIFQTTGECHGYITEKQAGTNGFGYDPIFVPMAEILSAKDLGTTPTLPLGEDIPANVKLPSPMSKVSEGRNELKIRTIAEMSDDEKNTISHRGNALRKVLEFLKDYSQKY